MPDPLRTEQNRLPEPMNEFRGITNKDGVGSRSFAAIAKLWAPRGTTAEPAASTVSRYSLRVIDRATGKAYSAEELPSFLGSEGGHGNLDYGKLAAFGETGGLLLGSTTADAPTQGMLYVVCGTGTAVGASNLAVGGVVYEAGMGAAGVIGYSVHLGPQAGQVGLGIDGSGGVASGIGYFSYMPGLAMVAADADFKETISIGAGNGDAAGGWVAWSTGGDRGGNEIRLKAETADALRVLTLPNVTGYLPAVPAYADLTAANAALASGDFWWDTTLKKLRTATA